MNIDTDAAFPTTLREEVARRVVARAIAMTDRHDGVRVADLRTAMIEIGVSQVDFDAALAAEMSAGMSRRSSFIHRFAIATGVVVGVASAGTLLLPHFFLPYRQLALAVIMMTSGGIALAHRPSRSVGRFLTANTGLWVAFYLSFAALGPAVGFSTPLSDWFGAFGLMWVATSALGSAAIRFRNASRANSEGEGPSIGSSLRSRVARTLQWIADRVQPMSFMSARVTARDPSGV